MFGYCRCKVQPGCCRICWATTRTCTFGCPLVAAEFHEQRVGIRTWRTIDIVSCSFTAGVSASSGHWYQFHQHWQLYLAWWSSKKCSYPVLNISIWKNPWKSLLSLGQWFAQWLNQSLAKQLRERAGTILPSIIFALTPQQWEWIW